jgi:calcium/calmodulin-dependent protein kinase kinase 2
MKAVRKFRRLLDKTRPYVMDNMLGQDARIVQPPLSMNGDAPRHPALQHLSQSDDAATRRSAEQVLSSEGVQRRAKPEAMDLDARTLPDRSKMQTPPFQSKIVQPTPQRPNFSPRTPRKPAEDSPSAGQDSNATGSYHDGTIVQSPPGDVNSPRSPTEHLGKGQAHDPLADFRFLNVGSGDDYDAQPPGSPPAVCESPPAAELDIYEQAYHEEVERIRSRSMHSTLFLTRRVEDAAGVPRGDIEDGNEVEISPRSAGFASNWGDIMRGMVSGREPRRQQTAPALPAARVAAQAVMNRARDKRLKATQQAAEKMNLAAGSVQAKMLRVQEESARLRGEGGEAGKGPGDETGDDKDDRKA